MAMRACGVDVAMAVDVDVDVDVVLCGGGLRIPFWMPVVQMHAGTAVTSRVTSRSALIGIKVGLKRFYLGVRLKRISCEIERLILVYCIPDTH